ncbi:putative WD repeat-containing protein 92 [Toxoplasma gondii GAB2-2007-GAL-DOM2]|uniref:Putative WD repeat-containing protein 92 n=2 Tax=Toxoplasma gondii TaxID=5811 RepID=B9QIX8_TOXGV|nr:putative WD repeat-containing protein 92 [Toxoplasma gondii VEG]KFG35574.1 putative WD repeat-containing protein 92 [Toxoplasma gondii GAB2-2007-GAL-DOM2]CEL72220.1 TPA: WD domain, G-beta repeat-containing protein [Toxoplasma gondii VEG]
MDTKDAPQLIEHIHHSVAYTPFVTRWVPQTAKLLILGETPRGTGMLSLCSLEESSLSIVTKNEEQRSSFKSAVTYKSRSGATCIAAGHLDGSMTLWDLENLREPITKIKAHKASVNSIDLCGPSSGKADGQQSRAMIATGSADGCASVWDTRDSSGEILSIEPAEGEEAADCWAVAFGNAESSEDDAVLAAGYDNGDVKLFDMRAARLSWDTNLDYGVCHLQFDRKNIVMNKLAISCLEGHLFMADMRTFHPEEGYAKNSQKLSESTIWGAHFLPQNREIFATCAGNGQLALHRYSYPKQRVVADAETGLERGVVGTCERLNDKDASTQPLVSFDWHPNKLGLCAFASLDQAVRVYIVTKLNLY